ncbi:MAG: flagellar hook capping protein [Lachnospiraceae bacterium]|nr:flagellar hook capping protein [Lachnospiraceae bacterium]
MAVSAVVKDGKIEETMSESSVKKAASKTGMDKDAFLQLLVAQMKYQDPLEPTSNTEFISQYATFSQVEQMQNMAATMELTRASSMVGKLVAVETTDKMGDVKQLQGMVQYVTYENGKAYVSIDGNLYSADDVTAIIDETYQNAYDLAVAFVAAMDKLPRVERLTIDDREAVETLQKGFNNMTSYQQSFISDEYIKKLQDYVTKMAELVEFEESLNKDKDSQNTDTEGTDEGDGGTAEPAEPTE